MIEYLDEYYFYDAALMPESPTVVEVGCFTTGRAKVLRARHPKSRICLIEPDPENYRALLQAIGGGTFEPYRAALSDRGGPAELFHYAHEQWHSTFPRHLRENLKLERTFTVAGMPLRTLLTWTQATPCDLLLLNCEGAEIHALEALAAGAELRAQVRQVCTSFHCDHVKIYPPARRDQIVGAMARWYDIRRGKFEPIPYYLFTRRT